MPGWIEEWKRNGGKIDGWIGGWTNELDGWVGGWINRYTFTVQCLINLLMTVKYVHFILSFNSSSM